MQCRHDRSEQAAFGALALCNACGYCRGYCPVFDQSRQRPMLEKADLLHLSFLCHDCGACLDACQYAPPHTFAIDIRRELGNLRNSAYQSLGVPRWAEGFFWRIWSVRRMMVSAIPAAVGISLVPSMAAPHSDDFAKLISSATLAVVAGSIFLWLIIWTWYRAYVFWRQTGRGNRFPAGYIPAAILRSITWRYYGSSSGRCDAAPRQSILRNWCHRSLLLGLASCFLATFAGALQRHAFNAIPPFPYQSAPVALGLIGGVFMCGGAIGLIYSRRVQQSPRKGDTYLTAELLAVGMSGLVLLMLREATIAMFLAYLHLILVADLFLRLPFSHFLHGPFRVISIALMLSDDAQRLSAAGRLQHRIPH
jgi:citrate/tricarballylate utilization protein